MAHRSLSLTGLLALVATAQASTFVTATGTNTTLGTAQLFGLTPVLVVPQIPPNFTIGTAQPVSPLYYAEDALGSIGPGHTDEFFSFNLNVGDPLHMRVDTTNPATQAVELLLYDASQNLVAISNGNASNGVSSIIDFTVPSGDAGLWTAQVTGSPSGPPNPVFSYDLRFGSPVDYLTTVQGALTDPTEPGFYGVASNSGDHLHFFASTTNGLKADELLLYDPHGNLVAIANGNFSNGLWSVIDFTVPNGDAGTWIVEVTGSPSVPDPNTDLFQYDLQISGATGTGPIDPLSPPAAPVTTPEPAYTALFACFIAGVSLLRRARGTN